MVFGSDPSSVSKCFSKIVNLWSRLHAFGSSDPNFGLVKLVSSVLAPCLILHTLLGSLSFQSSMMRS